MSVRKAGSSCGAIIEVRARGIPLGLGAPIYSKLDMDLAAAMMSINAVKGVNIGSGMNSAQLSGEQNSDEIFQRGNQQNLNQIMPVEYWGEFQLVKKLMVRLLLSQPPQF